MTSKMGSADLNALRIDRSRPRERGFPWVIVIVIVVGLSVAALLALIATTVLALTVVLSGQRRIVTEARQAVRFDPAQPARTAT